MQVLEEMASFSLALPTLWMQLCSKHGPFSFCFEPGPIRLAVGKLSFNGILVSCPRWWSSALARDDWVRIAFKVATSMTMDRDGGPSSI